MRQDPEGKAALFGSHAGEPSDDTPLHTAGDGPVLITCSECDSGTRVSYGDLSVRLLSISLWNPRREHAHWIRCPACERRNWCRVSL